MNHLTYHLTLTTAIITIDYHSMMDMQAINVTGFVKTVPIGTTIEIHFMA